MARNATPVVSHISGRNVRPLVNFDASEYEALSRLGINISDRQYGAMAAFSETGMDAIEGLVTTASIIAPVQFLQNWLPGFVTVITQARKVDMLLGITTAGAWEDEEIVQGYLEHTGKAVPYGDYTDVPFSSWNSNYETRTVVRFEEGLQVGLLESARASRVKIDSAVTKRQAATNQLEIQRNAVGFFGYNNGSNYTFGFLNEPNLGAYVEVAAGSETGNPTSWSLKSYLEIVADIRTAFAKLRVQSGDNIDPKALQITLAVATASVDYLSVVSQYGNSVQDWLDKTYPNTRVVSAPELDGAELGDNVFYLYAESVPDGSSDDDKTWMQVVPSKFKMLGIQQMAKKYIEDFSNATAGALLKRPFAVVRYYGI
jgi:hypothetical protein